MRSASHCPNGLHGPRQWHTHTRTRMHTWVHTSTHTHMWNEWSMLKFISRERVCDEANYLIRVLNDLKRQTLRYSPSHTLCVSLCATFTLWGSKASPIYIYIYIHLYYIYYIYIHIIYMYIYLNANVVCSHVSKHLYCCTNDNKRSVSSALRGAQRRWSAIC